MILKSLNVDRLLYKEKLLLYAMVFHLYNNDYVPFLINVLLYIGKSLVILQGS